MLLGAVQAQLLLEAGKLQEALHHLATKQVHPVSCLKFCKTDCMTPIKAALRTALFPASCTTKFGHKPGPGTCTAGQPMQA